MSKEEKPVVTDKRVLAEGLDRQMIKRPHLWAWGDTLPLKSQRERDEFGFPRTGWLLDKEIPANAHGKRAELQIDETGPWVVHVGVFLPGVVTVEEERKVYDTAAELLSDWKVD